MSIQPNIPLFSFSKFRSVCLCNKWAGKCICFTTHFSPNEFCTRNNISPLVAATHLQFAVFILIQPIKIITLHQLVRKFCKAHSRIAFPGVSSWPNSFFYAILSHHVVYSNMFSDVANKTQKAHILKPVIVVHHFRAVGL